MILGSGGNPYPSGITYVQQYSTLYTITGLEVTPDGSVLYSSHGNGNLLKHTLSPANSLSGVTQVSNWGVAVSNTNRGIMLGENPQTLYYSEASAQDSFWKRVNTGNYDFVPATQVSNTLQFDISGSYTGAHFGASIAENGHCVVITTNWWQNPKGWFCYRTPVAWDFTQAVFDHHIFQGLTWNPAYGEWNEDGSMFTSSDITNSRILQWDCSTAYDFSTRGTARILTLTGQIPYVFKFIENGQKLLVSVYNTVRIREYTLNPAYVIPNTTI